MPSLRIPSRVGLRRRPMNCPAATNSACCWQCCGPALRLLLMEHPTRGLDIESANWVWSQLLARREHGTAIVFASADLDELLRYSNRIMRVLRGQGDRGIGCRRNRCRGTGLLDWWQIQGLGMTASPVGDSVPRPHSRGTCLCGPSPDAGGRIPQRSPQCLGRWCPGQHCPYRRHSDRLDDLGAGGSRPRYHVHRRPLEHRG